MMMMMMMIMMMMMMMMVQRLTYRKQHSYATKSNQHRVVKTLGDFPFYEFLYVPFLNLDVYYSSFLKIRLQKGDWCIKPQRREPRAPNALLLERESKGYLGCPFGLKVAKGSNLNGKCGKDIGCLHVHPGLPGGGAKDCEKDVKDSNGKGKASCKELKMKGGHRNRVSVRDLIAPKWDFVQ
ncbi:hypothetical protein Cgig2_008780 [Carnegiea gigantea]|uniref:Uncharacterized protein n=1 Tax=Carnegiea gigantea TaxID=171969 RepID=A0A9Q1JS22_9CARY|nr:hypothetical protein Cgig2_008780 [Carnegiea gigantea]